jgi:hypothetical protein
MAAILTIRASARPVAAERPLRERNRIGRTGAIELRWLLALLLVCVVSLLAGFLVGMWLGS